ncbi:hypothetical protein PLANPX_1667 [Lacipirellula parvula]|uniref:Uncharacterized protein n=1 Tax=Lacipirellula parvula TaxID=2650471 RepID=A0A5K7X6R1_9BACT|nr:hypothetical protein PLANPX_1667 [Lacipirellula parvula]
MAARGATQLRYGPNPSRWREYAGRPAALDPCAAPLTNNDSELYLCSPSTVKLLRAGRARQKWLCAKGLRFGKEQSFGANASLPVAGDSPLTKSKIQFLPRIGERRVPALIATRIVSRRWFEWRDSDDFIDCSLRPPLRTSIQMTIRNAFNTENTEATEKTIRENHHQWFLCALCVLCV